MSCLIGVFWFVWEPRVRLDSVTVWFMTEAGQTLEWGLAIPEGTARRLRVGTLGHMVSVHLETEVNHVVNQSINHVHVIKSLTPRLECASLVGNTPLILRIVTCWYWELMHLDCNHGCNSFQQVLWVLLVNDRNWRWLWEPPKLTVAVRSDSGLCGWFPCLCSWLNSYGEIR